MATEQTFQVRDRVKVAAWYDPEETGVITHVGLGSAPNYRVEFEDGEYCFAPAEVMTLELAEPAPAPPPTTAPRREHTQADGTRVARQGYGGSAMNKDEKFVLLAPVTQDGTFTLSTTIIKKSARDAGIRLTVTEARELANRLLHVVEELEVLAVAEAQRGAGTE